jgi:hypothetical protein
MSIIRLPIIAVQVFIINGTAYGGSYDDQGGQSSTLSVAHLVLVTMELGTIG